MKRLALALYCILLVVSVAAPAHGSPSAAAQPGRAEPVPLKRENGTFLLNLALMPDTFTEAIRLAARTR